MRETREPEFTCEEKEFRCNPLVRQYLNETHDASFHTTQTCDKSSVWHQLTTCLTMTLGSEVLLPTSDAER